MAKAVPSQIENYLSENLPLRDTYTELQQKVGVIAGFLTLYGDVPHELINLPPKEYATLVADIATIRLAMDRYRAGSTYEELNPIGRALPRAREIIRKLPDAFPSKQHDLAFVNDATLREMIGIDLDAVRIDLQSGEWKGATVIAGSCSEALLLYGLQERERNAAGAISSAVAAVPWKEAAPSAADPTDRSWDLFCYTAVAHKMKLIGDSTKKELDTARDYRNLIHPAKAIREKVCCDRGTAYVSAGAMDHVIRDLKNNL